jgi:predicted nucleotidyltransferase component of viral defense system
MACLRASQLTALQSALLDAFFRHEQRMFLTGGAALAGFHLGHRTTEDLNLFAPPALDLAEVARALQDAAADCGATLTPQQTHPRFRRALAVRGAETCVVDLVIDTAPMIDSEKLVFGLVRVDTVRESTANKICTLLSRCEIKDLLDLGALLEHVQPDARPAALQRALGDACLKDASVDAATLAWLLSELTISPEARLPGQADPAQVDALRLQLVSELRTIAFEQTQT